MKKIIAMLLVMVMVISMAACTPANNETSSTPAASQQTPSGSGNNEPDPTGTIAGGSASGIDMSQFPAKFEDWDADDVNKYFAEAGVFTKEEWIYVQPHAEYYPGMAVNDGCGYMDTDGMIMIMMFTFDVNSTEADVPAYMESIRTDKKLDEMMGSFPVDHMLGHVIFMTSFTVDEAVYNAMEAAIQQLAEDVGIALDF